MFIEWRLLNEIIVSHSSSQFIPQKEKKKQNKNILRSLKKNVLVDFKWRGKKLNKEAAQ